MNRFIELKIKVRAALCVRKIKSRCVLRATTPSHHDEYVPKAEPRRASFSGQR